MGRLPGSSWIWGSVSISQKMRSAAAAADWMTPEVLRQLLDGVKELGHIALEGDDDTHGDDSGDDHLPPKPSRMAMEAMLSR